MQDPLILFAAGLLGLVMGSFFSMLSWRLPRKLIAEYEGREPPPLWTFNTRSACPQCQTTLPWYRLIPLFSYLLSKGRCHACGQPISLRYPLIELSTALLSVAAVWHFGLTLTGGLALLFSWLVLLLVIIDLEHKLLLDALTYPLLWLGLLANTQTVFTSLESAVWGAALGYLILWSVYWLFKLLTGKEGMGYGDFKMLAALGAWFGVEALPGLILLSAFSAIVIQLTARLFGKGEQQFPFGPYLGAAGLLWLYFGASIQSLMTVG